MKKLKSLPNSQRTAIFILLIFKFITMKVYGTHAQKIETGRKSITQS